MSDLRPAPHDVLLEIRSLASSLYEGSGEREFLNRLTAIRHKIDLALAQASPVLTQPKALAPEMEARVEERIRCHAQKDGDCDWEHCPQRVNRQSHCPRDIYYEDEDN